jgi:pimeloyl-ACP methyl ester carboxylesterase
MVPTPSFVSTGSAHRAVYRTRRFAMSTETVSTLTGHDAENPDRGPLLIISGEKDNTVPWAIASASFKKQKRNVAATEIVEMPNRGHSLTIDDGWREVADTALAFIRRSV